ncbi:MAG: hypothetical protein ACR2PT_07550 [Endozoicomonas sp.]
MARVRSMQYDDQDETFWDGSKEYRKARSNKDQCKQKRASSIRQGIDDYWDKKQLRQNTADSYEDYGIFDDLDDDPDEYHYQ